MATNSANYFGEELSIGDLEMIHQALTEQKNRATKGGRVWSGHTRNAFLRTEIECELGYRRKLTVDYLAELFPPRG